jgi:hypothetical protein
MELTEGDSETLNLIVRNEGDAPLHRVFIYDQELEEAGFTLTYSENLFNLNKGEEKLIKVKISSSDKMQPRSYIGTIAFKTEKGLHSWLDVTIKTKEKTAAAAETREEAHVAFGYKTKDAAAKKQEAPRGTRATIAQRVRTIQEQEEPIFESVPEKKAPGKAKMDRTLTGLFGESEERPPEKKQEPAPPRTGFGPSTPTSKAKMDRTLTGLFGESEEKPPEKKQEPAPPKPPAPKVEEPPQTPAPPAPAPVPPQKEEPKPSEPAPTPAPEPPKPAPSAPVPERKPTPRPKYVEPEPAPAPAAPAPPQQEPQGRRVEIVKKQVEEVEKRVEKQSIGPLEMMKPLLSLIRPAKPGKFLRRKKQ